MKAVKARLEEEKKSMDLLKRQCVYTVQHLIVHKSLFTILETLLDHYVYYIYLRNITLL